MKVISLENLFKVLILLIINSGIQTLSAQTVHVVPNPPNRLASDDLAFNYPVIFNNKLYIDTDSLNGVKLNCNLAEYDGDTLRVIPNPTSKNCYNLTMPVIFDNKICYQYNDSGLNSIGHLAVFDGNSFTEIANSNLYTPSFWTVYGNKLYYFNGGNDGVYDGNTAHADTITSTDDIFSVYNNYLLSSDGMHLHAFNGISSITYSNPNNGACENFAANNQQPYKLYRTIYDNKLYLEYSDSTTELAQFDGTNLSIVPGSNGYYGFGIISNNNLYFQILRGTALHSQLAKYDGTNVTLIPNPDSTGQYVLNYFNAAMTSYNNNLYLIYKSASNINQLVRYDGNTLTVIPNPDGGYGFSGSLFVYNNLLYSSYIKADGSGELVSYDGTNLKFIPTQDGSNVTFLHPIVFNNKFYFSTDNNLAYLDESTLALTLSKFNAQLNNNNVNLNWQTALETNTKYFNIQRSIDGIHFSTISTKAAAGNSTSTKKYFYTDINVATLHVTKLFYRLQEIDEDGNNNYSKVQTIEFRKSNILFTISPNPAKDYINISASDNIVDAQISIADMNGRILYSIKKNFSSVEQVKISTLRFAKQILLVTINADNMKQQFKVVKE